MDRNPRLLIAGGSGVFGRLLARELLATTDAELILAGRDLYRATAVARALGPADRAVPMALDLNDLDAVARAAEGCFAVVCAAGPFQALPPGLPAVVARAGAHWLDLSDDAAFVGRLLADERLCTAARAAGRAVMPGLSTIPALSGALVGWCCQRTAAPSSGRVTLLIGNRNAKGTAAIASALGAGLNDPLPVELPIGRYRAYRFTYSDAALLAGRPGVSVEFRVAFEWAMAGYLMAVLARVFSSLSPGRRSVVAGLLARLAAPTSRLGSTIGCLQAEVFDRNGSPVIGSFVGVGQRLAILPCALATAALLGGTLDRRGVIYPSSWLTPDEWIARLRARGIQFVGRWG